MSFHDSFSKYRTPEDDSSDESDFVEGSFANEEEIAETDSESYSTPVKAFTKKKKKMVLSSSEESAGEAHSSRASEKAKSRVISSDESESEESSSESSDSSEERFERQTLSPRTRQSIGGFRPRDLTSDESDLEEGASSKDLDDSDGRKSYSKNGELHQNKSLPGPKQTDSMESVYTNEEDDLHSFDAEYGQVKPRVRKSMNETRNNFNNSIVQKLSSTNYENSLDANKHLANSSGKSEDSIEIVSVQEPVINLSSPIEITATSTPSETAKKSIQPKINAVLGTPKSSKNEAIYVSKDFYEKEMRKLEEMKNELAVCANIMQSLGNKLPDKGKRMSGKSDQLKQDIKRQAEYITRFVIEEEKKVEKPFFNQGAPSWSEISAAVNDIQPKYTGKIGLANFNAQKMLTIDRLKDIHGSLETCPAEDVLADEPKGLKVELMNHQKHALAWMNWREKQCPKGGILADDMGLGKTLTMISLLLDTKQNRQKIESESNSEEDDNNKGWNGKGRRDYHNGGTLVVCPASLVRQWESEVEKHTKRNLITVCVHHGNNRDSKPRNLVKYDMVVTTYNIVARESKSMGALFGVKWHRIILDEAHVVRNHKSQSSEGVCNLRGKNRWVLTGTPIQNKEMDLYALLKFLRCSPFDDLGHWKRWIESKNSASGQQRLHALMKSLMLRRTKAQLQENGSLQCLPERDTELIEVHLDKDEMNVYQKIMIFSRTLFSEFLHQRAEKQNDVYYKPQGDRPTFMQNKDPNGAFFKMHQKIVRLHGAKEIQAHQILVLLLRLRQICCHPGLIDAMLEDDDNENQQDDSDTSQPEIDLLEQLNNLNIDDNKSESLHGSENDSKDERISRASSKVLLKSNPVFDLNRPSTKMKKVLEVLEAKILNSSDKAIIVSQWTSVLEILKTHLARKGLRLLCLNGSVPVHKRQEIITEFNDPKKPVQVLLLSLTAGGVGLNLVGANHLLLIDLHWNPQLESQAQDRIYRVGQKKAVHVYKFMCKDTVEERIKALQEHKLALANSVLTGAKPGVGSKLTMDDLMGLFEMKK